MMTSALESAQDGDLRSTFGLDEPDESWFQRAGRADAMHALGRLGEYELLEEIGRGGQGTVYKARRASTPTLFALKRLAAGMFATSEMKGRLQRELDIAATLDHPNIVRVHSIESIDGQPVLTMDWIEGVAIDEWALHAHGAPARPARTAPRPVREALEVFARVCDAVGYAHRHGVLHRDLKPSNILVDPNGEPHVLDFGLAKLTGPYGGPNGAPGAGVAWPSITQGSGFMGTPTYASPEQVAGHQRDVDLRSDVYALGAVLYRMLTGAPPFGPFDNLANLFDAIRNNDPPCPSTRRRGLDDEIDAIVLKAIEKQPARRYQSVSALGEDVRRFLANETVLAHPPSAAYQARKFIARHKAPVVGAAIALAALVLGLVGVSLSLVETRAAQQESDRAQRDAEQIDAFLNQMLATADPGVTRGRDVTVNAMLGEAVSKLDEGALAGQGQAEAQVRMTIADAYLSLGLYPPAQDQYEAALKLRQHVLGEMHLDVADSMLKLAFVLTRQEQFDAAHQNVDEALRIRTTLAGPDSLPVVQALAARAEIWMKMGRSEDARPILCALLPRVIQLTGNEDNDDVALIKGRLGYCDGCAGVVQDGIRLLEETLAIERRLFGPEHERLSRTLINLGVKHMGERNYELAESLLKEALAIRRRVYGNEHPATAIALFNLGSYYHNRQRWAEAEAAMREALTIQELRLVPGHYEIGRSRHFLAYALMRQNRCDEAEPLFRRAIEELKDQPSFSQARRSAHAQIDLTDCLVKQQRFEEAETLMLEAVEWLRQRGDSTQLVRIATKLARLYEVWGKPDQAEVWKKQLPAQAGSQQPATSAPDQPARMDGAMVRHET